MAKITKNAFIISSYVIFVWALSPAPLWAQAAAAQASAANDSEELLDFDAEEKAQDAESAAIQAAAGPGHGLAQDKAARANLLAGGRDTKAAASQPGLTKEAAAKQAAQQKQLDFWRTQPYPEHEYSTWLAVAPGLLLLWMAWQIPWRKSK